MRLFIATDGSDAAQVAIALAAAETWPPATTVRLVTVVEDEAELIADQWPAVALVGTEDLAANLAREGEAVLEAAAVGLRAAGLAVETAVLRGHPASAVVHDAETALADVIIVGSRGGGPFASLLLGSVSAGIVDLSRLPVLVVRGGLVHKVVLGTDGSPAAEAARAVIGGWPMFDGADVYVTSVVDPPVPWWTGMAEVAGGSSLPAYTEAAEQARLEAQGLTTAVAGDLKAHGRTATGEVREGDAAHEIVLAARERSADLIVVGSRGHRGITRLFLGSVARNVLYHAPCSVLVVHAPTAAAGAATAA